MTAKINTLPGQGLRPARARNRVIAAVCLGNALEFYDFLVYSLLATLMARLFFPFGDGLTSLMLSFAVFGTGFVMRPLGGLLIGLYADRVGRRSAIRLTLWMMAIGALMFTVAPTYTQGGLIGPLMVIAARLLQGFAVGGQVGTATTILMENASDGSRAFYCSWQVFSQSLGVFLGALVVLLLSNALSPAAMDNWGWRAVFGVGILAIPISEYLRHRLEETLPASSATQPGAAPSEQGLGLLAQYPRQLVTGVLLVIGVSVPVYITQFYLANHAIGVLGMPLSSATWAALMSSFPALLLAPWAGKLSDRIGRRLSIFWPLPILLVAIYPAFALLNQNPSLWLLLLTVGLLSVPLTFSMVGVLATLPELFPPAIRATGLSVSYCIGVALFGGFAQFFATGLIGLTGSPNAPAWYLAGAVVLCLVGLKMLPGVRSAQT
jgi:MFS family permease